MIEPMSDYRLAEIRRRSDNYGHKGSVLAQDRRELLAEVDRLREERSYLKQSYLDGLAALRAHLERS